MDKPLLKDIGGYIYQKEEAKKIVNFLRNYELYKSHGAKLAKGILLYGIPGTGKTMFALAIANEGNVPLYELTSDEFYNESNISLAVKKVFNEAKKNAPSIVLIDELDRLVNCEIGIKKQESDKQREALRSLLTEIDALKDSGVLIIATANCDLYNIPVALVRNGRIEKHIDVNAPDKEDRKEILDIYLSKNECFKNVDTNELASYTSGFTGADISALANETLIDCITYNKDATFLDFLEPIQAIKNSGVKKKKSKNNDPTIYHEIGHFVADYILNNKIGMINVIARGNVGGSYSEVEIEDNSDMSNKTYTQIRNECIVGISGIIATQVMLGYKYMGGSNDLDNITIKYNALASNGLLDYETVALQRLNANRYDSVVGDYNCDYLKKFAKFIEDISVEAKLIIFNNKDIVNALYKELKKKQVLLRNEIKDIVDNVVNNRQK